MTMQFFLAGTLVGIVISNVWNALIGPGLRKHRPAYHGAPKLRSSRKRHRP